MKKRSNEEKKEAPKKWFTKTKKIILSIIVIILIASAVYLVLNKQTFVKPVVKQGDTVYVNYIGRINETVFDTNIETVAKAYNMYNANRKYSPMEVLVGGGKLIKGFEDALYGMKEGEKKTITIPPERAYGNVDQSKIVSVPKSAINTTENFTVGTVLRDQAGRPAVIVAVNDSHLKVDMNAPLAGKTLTFDITLMKIKT